MKDDCLSFSINIFALKDRLCNWNLFQNGINTFSKMVNHAFFAKKLKILYIS